MQKEYISLGLMSGTSGDGVDASLIRSDGITYYEVLLIIHLVIIEFSYFTYSYVLFIIYPIIFYH